jgi:hypothetical protein
MLKYHHHLLSENFTKTIRASVNTNVMKFEDCPDCLRYYQIFLFPMELLSYKCYFLLCYGYMKYLFMLVEHWIFQDHHMNSNWSSPVTLCSIGESSSLCNIINLTSPLLGQNIILTTLSSNTLNIFSSLERHCCNIHNDDDHVDGMRLSLWTVATKGPISQVIYDYEEPRGIILTGENICPPELSCSSTSSHIAANQEELAKDVINLYFRSIFVRT